jgi:hypothetical protein
MNTIKTLLRQTVIKKIQVDTLFGIAFFGFLVYLLSMFTRVTGDFAYIYPFIIAGALLSIFNIVIDLLGYKTKYPLLDGFLFIGLIVYFYSFYGNLYTEVITLSPHLGFNFEATSVAKKILNELRNSYNSMNYFGANLRFWGSIIMFFFAFYSFMARYDSRFKKSTQRTTLAQVLGNAKTLSRGSSYGKRHGASVNALHTMADLNLGSTINETYESKPNQYKEEDIRNQNKKTDAKKDLFDEILERNKK